MDPAHNNRVNFVKLFAILSMQSLLMLFALISNSLSEIKLVTDWLSRSDMTPFSWRCFKLINRDNSERELNVNFVNVK